MWDKFIDNQAGACELPTNSKLYENYFSMQARRKIFICLKFLV